jgi:putative DNA primase/helicase
MSTTKPKRPTAAELEPLDPDVIEQEERARLEQQKAAAAPYRVLGWCAERSRIFYQHSQTGQITSIKPAAQAGPLLHLAPIEWWEEHYGREKGGTDWPAACSGVIEAANSAGVFAPERLRGRGVWMDGNAVVWHLGDRLEVNGQIMELIAHRSAHHYPRLPVLDIDPAAQPLTDSEGAAILKAVSAMGWATPLDPIHLLGWAMLANVGGALDKRPVLQITSRFGSGKSYTREQVLALLLAGLAISTSNSTEAGIRQTLGADTLPVLIDESEGEDHCRREGHLRLARLSFDGTPTSRGTAGGQALAYAVRSSIAMAGINATIPNPADRSRAVVVGREQLPQVQWAPVDQRLRQLLTPQTGARLLRRTVTNLPTLRANVATFRRVVEGQLGSGAAARAGDTYGALLAGAHLLTSTALVDDAQAIAWLDSIGWSAAAALGQAGTEEQDATAESRQCLAHLLAHEEVWRLDTGTGRLSVRELIDLASSSSGADEAEQARKALGRRGIKATDMGLLIANLPEALAPIYGSSKWRNGAHRARLRDLPGSDSPSNPQRFPVIDMQRCTRIPWTCID